MKPLVLFLIFAAIVTSCSKEVQVDLPETSPKAVLNCLFTNDSIFKVYVSKTASMLSTDTSLWQEAKVFLFEDASIKDTLIQATHKGEYISKIKPEAGKTYQIKATVSGLPEITSMDVIPNKGIIRESSFKDSALHNGDFYLARIKVTIEDNGNERNFYEILVNSIYVDSSGLEKTKMVSCSAAEISDAVLEAEGLLPYDPIRFVFSDAMINGASHEFTFYGFLFRELQNKKIVISLRSVSESYYTYRKKAILHTKNNSGSFWTGVGTPVNMYSNINNGYGIFAGYSSTSDTIDIK